jgi:hypothetical protein
MASCSPTANSSKFIPRATNLRTSHTLWWFAWWINFLNQSLPVNQIQEAPGGNKFEGNNAGTSYYPVSVIQHESPQRQQQQQSTSGASMGHGHHHQRIEIVQPTIITTSHGSFEHLTAVPNSGGAHVIHYNAPPHHTHGQPYTIQLEQPMSHRSMGSSSSHRISIDANLLSPVDEKLLLQKAKRAERARRRYCIVQLPNIVLWLN